VGQRPGVPLTRRGSTSTGSRQQERIVSSHFGEHSGGGRPLHLFRLFFGDSDELEELQTAVGLSIVLSCGSADANGPRRVGADPLNAATKTQPSRDR
jgi:hypothetical protein